MVVHIQYTQPPYNPLKLLLVLSWAHYLFSDLEAGVTGVVECTLAKSDNSISMKTHISSVPLFNVCLRENNLLEAAKAFLHKFVHLCRVCSGLPQNYETRSHFWKEATNSALGWEGERPLLINHGRLCRSLLSSKLARAQGVTQKAGIWKPTI